MKSDTIYELSSGGIVYKKDGDVSSWLLIRHASAKHWGFPKGHVGDKIPDETLEDAALREVREEGGVQAAIISPQSISTHYYFKSKDHLHKKTVHYFLMKYVSGDTADHDNEVSESKFVPEDEVFELITYKSDKEAFLKALDKLKNLL